MYIGKKQRQKLRVLQTPGNNSILSQNLQVGRTLQIFLLSSPLLYNEGRKAQMRNDLLRSWKLSEAGGISKALAWSLTHAESGRKNKVHSGVRNLLRLEEKESTGIFLLKYWFRANCKEYTRHREIMILGPTVYIEPIYQVCAGTESFGSACFVIVLDRKISQPYSARLCTLWFVKSPFISVGGGALLYIEKSW